MNNKPGSISKSILLTALLAGILDGTAACIYYISTGGKDPGIVFKFIASGLVGREKAFSGGMGYILLGLAIHFFVAFCFTIFYFWVQPRSFLKRNVILSAFTYGIFAWSVMNLVVIPLSRIKQRPFDLQNAMIGAGILVICIGLPLALMARKYYLYRK
jgi:hypothetical protein